MDRLPMWFQWVAFSCIHGCIVGGVIAGIFTALGCDFWSWFAWAGGCDAALVCFNVWADSKVNE